MTEPQPYTEADVPVLVSQMGGSSVGRQVAQERLVATVRAYQRVLAENAALRADAQRWRFVRSRGMVAVNEDDEPCFCAWLRESEIPDTLHPSVMEGGGTKDPEQLDDVVDAARSGGA